jgi:predicted Zn-dependent peptidase
MRVFLLTALGGLALTAMAAVPLDAQAGRISYDTFSLANGLRVIASEDHSTPIVAVDVWYNTGSRNERTGRSGFAHLFEHMMFQGSAHVKKAQHFQLVQRAGGQTNGSTQEDRTNYFEVLPSNRLNLALWLEADRMRSLAITQENFENQRETVKEERRLRVDNQPYQRAFVDGLTLPYDSTTCFPYAHSVIGDMADLNDAKLPDVQAFFDTYYAPNNATLVVVGDFNPAELRRLVTQYFTSIPSHPAPPQVSCEYRLSPGTMRREYADEHANLPAVVRLYRVPPHDDADTPALSLMNVILGQGESSRLNVAIVRRAKAALGAGAGSAGTHRGPGTMFVFGVANQGVDIDHLDSLLAAQVDTLRQSGVTADELTKAKNSFRSQFIENRETALSKAEELHHYAMFHSSLADINTDLDRYLAVTNDDIRRVAAKYLDSANAVILIVKPAAGGGQ